MKILQVSPHYYPYYGGVEEVVKQYSERLTKNHQVKVEVLTSGETANILVINGVKVTYLSKIPEFLTRVLPFGPYIGSINKVGTFLEKTDYDLAHLHANKRFIVDVASIKLNKLNKPFVFSPHAGQFGSSLLGKIHNRTISQIVF